LHAAKDIKERASVHRRVVGDIFQALSSVLPRINTLISRSDGVSMSDAIIIQAVYIAIGPFFVVEFGAEGAKNAKDKAISLVLSTLGGNSALRGLRLSALALIRSVSPALF
jgi:cohesin loading factor subunit SCC2